MPNPYDSIVASQLVLESTSDARRKSYDYFVTEGSSRPLITDICITPTLTGSSYYTDPFGTSSNRIITVPIAGRSGTGALVSGLASIVGVGSPITQPIGSGILVSTRATLAGIGDVATAPASPGSGFLLSGLAIIDGAGTLEIIGSGALSGTASISGIGFVGGNGPFIGFPFGLTYSESEGYFIGFPFGLSYTDEYSNIGAAVIVAGTASISGVGSLPGTGDALLDELGNPLLDEFGDILTDV